MENKQFIAERIWIRDRDGRGTDYMIIIELDQNSVVINHMLVKIPKCVALGEYYIFLN